MSFKSATPSTAANPQTVSFRNLLAPTDEALRPSRAHGDRLMCSICWLLCLLSAAFAHAYDTWPLVACIAMPLAILSTVLTWRWPGALVTRLSVAFIFMTYAALFIDQFHGLIEMHFSVFVLLAFLLFYRDWRTVTAAVLTIAVLHFLFSRMQLVGRHFYGTVLGCPEGRSSEQWIDFNLFGHQIVAHLKPRTSEVAAHANAVDGHDVPVPHFGVVLEQQAWEQLAERVRAAGVRFIIEPYTRFQGQPGEQSTMFFLDPAGNALEFKAFADLDSLFAK